MAKVGGDNEKVGRVCQVLAEQLPIFKFFILAQGTYKHGDDAKFVFVAAKTDHGITSLSTGRAPHCTMAVDGNPHSFTFNSRSIWEK